MRFELCDLNLEANDLTFSTIDLIWDLPTLIEITNKELLDCADDQRDRASSHIGDPCRSLS